MKHLQYIVLEISVCVNLVDLLTYTICDKDSLYSLDPHHISSKTVQERLEVWPLCPVWQFVFRSYLFIFILNYHTVKLTGGGVYGSINFDTRVDLCSHHRIGTQKSSVTLSKLFHAIPWYRFVFFPCHPGFSSKFFLI